MWDAVETPIPISFFFLTVRGHREVILLLDDPSVQFVCQPVTVIELVITWWEGFLLWPVEDKHACQQSQAEGVDENT